MDCVVLEGVSRWVAKERVRSFVRFAACLQVPNVGKKIFGKRMDWGTKVGKKIRLATSIGKFFGEFCGKFSGKLFGKFFWEGRWWRKI